MASGNFTNGSLTPSTTQLAACGSTSNVVSGGHQFEEREMMTTRCNCHVRLAIRAGEDLRGFGNEIHDSDCPLYQPIVRDGTEYTAGRWCAGLAKCCDLHTKYPERWTLQPACEKF